MSYRCAMCGNSHPELLPCAMKDNNPIITMSEYDQMKAQKYALTDMLNKKQREYEEELTAPYRQRIADLEQQLATEKLARENLERHLGMLHGKDDRWKIVAHPHGLWYLRDKRSESNIDHGRQMRLLEAYARALEIEREEREHK